MKNLKKLGAAFVLTCALGLTTFAGEIDTPPHVAAYPGQVETPPCAPGELQTPPCATAQATVPGQTDTPPMGELSLTEIASSVLLSIVSLF